MPVSDDFRSGVSSFNYKQRYKNLKRKFRYLIYENECFQEELKKAHRRLLKVNQDKSFLLDRLLQYEKVDDSSSDSDGTISSDSDLENFPLKKKRSNSSNFSNSHGLSGGPLPQQHTSRQPVAEPSSKRKKPVSKSNKCTTSNSAIESVTSAAFTNADCNANTMTPMVTSIKVEPEDTVPLGQGDGHMTSEEIERHLESRQTLLDMVPVRAPPTVPTEMFSNDLYCIDRFLAND